MDNAKFQEQAKALAHRLAEKHKDYEKNGYPVITTCYDHYENVANRLKESKAITAIKNKLHVSGETLSKIDEQWSGLTDIAKLAGTAYDAWSEASGDNPLKGYGIDPKSDSKTLKSALEDLEIKDKLKDSIVTQSIKRAVPFLMIGMGASGAGAVTAAALITYKLAQGAFTLEKHRRERLKKQQESESEVAKVGAGEIPVASGSNPGRNAKNVDASARHSLNGVHAASNISNGDVTVANIQKRVSNVITEVIQSRQVLAQLVYDVQARRDELDSIVEGNDNSLVTRAQQSYENAVSALEDDVLPRLTQIKSLLDDYVRKI